MVGGKWVIMCHNSAHVKGFFRIFIFSHFLVPKTSQRGIFAFVFRRVQNRFETQNGFIRRSFWGMQSLVSKLAFDLPEMENLRFFSKIRSLRKKLFEKKVWKCRPLVAILKKKLRKKWKNVLTLGGHSNKNIFEKKYKKMLTLGGQFEKKVLRKHWKKCWLLAAVLKKKLFWEKV